MYSPLEGHCQSDEEEKTQMSYNRHSYAGQLVRIYRRLPELECKGLCHESCGPIIIGPEEERVIAERYGSAPTWDSSLTCSKLSGRRCTIYADRPLLCRLWGTVEGMPCIFGCVPKGGRMSNKAARKLMRKVYGTTATGGRDGL